MITILCEKPNEVKEIANKINDGDYIICIQSINFFKFNLSDNTVYSFTNSYKYNIDNLACNFFYKKENCRLIKYVLNNNEYKKEITKIIKNANKIIITGTLDHTYVRGIDLYCSLIFEIDRSMLKYSSKLHNKYNFLNEIVEYDNFTEVIKYRNIYIKKDYFDYLFTERFKETKGIFDLDEYITANMIATLYLARNPSNSINTYHKLFSIMNNYNIGSPISQSEILRVLVKNSLLNESNDVISISNIGLELLSTIPKNLKKSSFIKLNKKLVNNSDIPFVDYKNKVDLLFEIEQE